MEISEKLREHRNGKFLSKYAVSLEERMGFAFCGKPVAALTVHRTVIHYRSFESHKKSKEKTVISSQPFLLEERMGFEPTVRY